jgi:hypothetical protein
MSFVMAGLAELHDNDDGTDTNYREILVNLAGSARRAGRRAVLSGRWLADTVVDLAPRVPVRDVEALSRHHGNYINTRSTMKYDIYIYGY